MNVARDPRRHVVIAGAGITGLAAAYYLQKAIEERSLPVRYTLLESSSRIGGKLLTDKVDAVGDAPFIIEGGPDCFLTQKPWAVELAKEIGIAGELSGTNDERRQVYVLIRGRPTRLPDGVLLIVPTKFMPFALSPMISPLGKLRMGMDLFIPRKSDDEDETLADFITRRLGSEALDKIAEPLMSGIYNAEADRQSIMATFPRFRAIEKEHGSLIKGMLASRRARSGASAPKPPSSMNGTPSTIFVTFKEGTQQLATEIHKRLTGQVELDATIRTVEQGEQGRYVLAVETDENQRAIDADAMILATPAYVSANLLREVAPDAASTLEQIRYVSTGTVSLAYRNEDLAGVADGFGLVIPQSEQRPINAITFSSTKFDNRAPQGYSLLRVFFGGSRSPQSMELGDEELVRVVRKEMKDILGIEAAPLFERIYRWHRANPQYDIGHLDRVGEIERNLPDRVVVAGSAYRGVGIPDCVHQAQIAVERILEQIYTEDVVGEAI